MSTLSKDDIRAAVAAGVLTEAQAASVLALADSRRGVRENLDGLDEPFELFKGFNEIFIVVGLGVLYTGYVGVSGVSFDGPSAGGMVSAAVGLVLLFALSRYFILTRRMVAPAIALSLMVAGMAGYLGLSLVEMAQTGGDLGLPLSATLVAAIMIGFWVLFHVPFALFLTAMAVFVAIFGYTSLGGASLDSPGEIFLLTADGPFSVITIVLGLIALILAMRFDMSDPHRVTRRAANGFWLHVVAAPAIMNTVALSLFDIGTVPAQMGVLAFVTAMAILAVAIDRRSFLISGVGYAVALAITVMEGGAFFIILLLGVVLVLLGAKWEVLRNRLMRSLPTFPGKDRLPPWNPAAPGQ